MAAILCVDDEPEIAILVEGALLRLGHDARRAASVAEAMAVLRGRACDLVLCDYSMPGQGGIDLIREVAAAGLDVPVIIMTGYASVEHAHHARQAGAADYLTKPIRLEALRIAVDQVLEVGRLGRACRALRRELAAARGGDGGIVGVSEAVRRAREAIAAVAPTGAGVLLVGEPGTGKALLARALHEGSPRHLGPFVAVDCAALPDGTAAAVLFGDVAGAGATGSGLGALERADRGTLLLHRIAALPVEVQASLARALRTREAEPVGGGRPAPVDVRLVATTDRDLAAAVAAGSVREELRDLLAAVVRVPPLRDRPEDIPLLVLHVAARAAARLGIASPDVDPEALAVLQRHPWPGNVRELADAVEHAVALARGGAITPRRLPPSLVRDAVAAVAVPDDAQLPTLSLDALEALAIRRALEATGGNRTRAARLLGISERTLRNKLNRPKRPATAPPAA
jgi:DNA-binding NtrC family response regulator